MALKLSLKPGERFVVNGAVIANGDRRTSLVIQNKVSILREKDIMQVEDVDTPAKRIYWPIMLMYLEERGKEQLYEEFVVRMSEFMGAVSNPAAISDCVDVSKDVMNGNYYRALMECKKLIAFEAERLGR